MYPSGKCFATYAATLASTSYMLSSLPRQDCVKPVLPCCSMHLHVGRPESATLACEGRQTRGCRTAHQGFILSSTALSVLMMNSTPSSSSSKSLSVTITAICARQARAIRLRLLPAGCGSVG